MVISDRLVGMRVDPLEHVVDERWTMAYAASLRDHSSVYFDTTQPEGVVAHPVFPVCVEWPSIVASRTASLAAGLSELEVLSSVHATHDLTIHRLARPGDVLTTTLDYVGLVDKSPGAMSASRLTTRDAEGELVAETTQHGIHLGHHLVGDDHPDPSPPAPIVVDRRGEPEQVSVDVLAGDAHTYTECARIWNPIHTDRRVAKSAGLPDIILHGTANLAHGVSAVVEARAGGDPTRVRRIVGRFGAMVRLPSTLTISVWPAVEGIVPFEVRNADGDPAVDQGAVVLGP